MLEEIAASLTSTILWRTHYKFSLDGRANTWTLKGKGAALTRHEGVAGSFFFLESS